MHQNNLKWLADLKEQMPYVFKYSRVLELGAAGTWPEVRALFEDSHYIGVDAIADPNVDIVSRATDTLFDSETFDLIVCLSMFEHDPDWRESLSHNLDFLKPGGYVIGCHGAEGNLHHGPDPWKIVPSGDFLEFCETLPVQVNDSFFEEERYGPDCAGAYDWLLEKTDD